MASALPVPPLRPSPRTGVADALQHEPPPSSGTLDSGTQDLEAFYARIMADGPTKEEIASQASPSYVVYLMDTVTRSAKADAAVAAKIDELARERHERAQQQDRELQQQVSELAELREQVAQLALQLQEERERSTRLLHENTVLCTQEAERKAQLTALISLAKKRGRALRLRADGSSARPPHSPTRVKDGPRPAHARGAPLADTLSLRAVTSAAAAASGSSAAMLLARVEESIEKDSDDDGAASAGNSALSPFVSRGSAHDRASFSGARSLAHASLLAGDAVGPADELTTSLADEELLNALRPSGNLAAAQLLALSEEVQMLRQQLDEQRTMYERERAVRLRDAREQQQQHAARAEKQMAALRQQEELQEASLRELVMYRHRTDSELRDAHGQVDWLKQSLQEAITVAELVKRRHDVRATAMEQRAATKLRPLVKGLSAELGSRRESSRHERQLFESAMLEKEQQLESLRGSVKHERALRRRAEERHRLEVTGVRSELDLMRQALRQVEKRVFFSRAKEELAAAEEQSMLAHYYQPS